jgi:hypothetical protein
LGTLRIFVGIARKRDSNNLNQNDNKGAFLKAYVEGAMNRTKIGLFLIVMILSSFFTKSATTAKPGEYFNTYSYDFEIEGSKDRTLIKEFPEFVIELFPSPKEIKFILVNKSEKPVKIIWDDCAIIDFENYSHKIIHSNIKYSDKDKPQPPTIVFAGVKVQDILIASDKVEFFNLKTLRWADWVINPLLPDHEGRVKPGVSDPPDAFVGKTFQVVFAIESGGKIDYFPVKLKVTNYRIYNPNTKRFIK